MARIKGWFSRKEHGRTRHIPISERRGRRRYKEEEYESHELPRGARGWGKAWTATFPGKCLSCGKPIHRGDRIYFRRKEGAIHANCDPPKDWIPSAIKKPRALTKSARLVDQIGGGVIQGAAEPAIRAIGVTLLPQYASAINFGLWALSVKQEYDSIEGAPEKRIVKVAMREVFKAGLRAITSDVVGNQLHDAVEKSVQTTAHQLSGAGVFERIASVLGDPSLVNAEDLQYMFASAAVRVVEEMYRGEENEITGYIARRLTP
jgi:hypothetical protein